MPLINQIRQFIIYTPTDSLNLLTASFLNSIVAIHRPIPNTNNYLSFRPEAGNLNVFTTLDHNVGYFIDSKPGSSFTIPDAPSSGGGSTTPVTVTGLGTISIADLRNLSTSQADGTGFIITDKNREGTFLLDSSDTTTKDDNGLVFVSKAGQRFKRVFNGPMNVTWFGIVPNDKSAMASNSAKLAAIIANNYGSHIKFNGSTNAYYIGRDLTRKITRFGDYCIGLIDTAVKLEGDPEVHIITETGTLGVLALRTIGESNIRIENLIFDHDGDRDAAPNDGCIGYRNTSDNTIVTTQPADMTGYVRVYTQDWGNYFCHGIALFGVGVLRNIKINGYPGNGLCVYGNTGIVIDSPIQDAPFTYGRYVQDGITYATFEPDNPDFRKPAGGTLKLYLNGVLNQYYGKVQSGGLIIGPVDANSPAEGSKGMATVSLAGKTLFADSMVIDGANDISHCGANAIFTTGNEANQSLFANFRVADNGGWGVCDSSLLKNEFSGLHSTANGNRFSYDTSAKIGAFTNRGDANMGSTLSGHQYREGGNEYLDDPTEGTIYSGGGVFTQGTPLTGGNGLIGNNLFGIRGQYWTAGNGSKWFTRMGDDGKLVTIQV